MNVYGASPLGSKNSGYWIVVAENQIRAMALLREKVESMKIPFDPNLVDLRLININEEGVLL